MREICFVKLTRCPREDGGRPIGETQARIDERAAMLAPFGLWLDADNRLFARLLAEEAGVERGSENGALLIATLKCLDEDGNPAWYLSPRSRRLGVNGAAPPLPLARLEPGGLLSIDRDFWWISSVWQPKPGPAPAEVADSLCPVCGARLSEAPVVQCPTPHCGRWSHLERGDDPGCEDALNCYLAADCPHCHRPATLDPVFVPEPHQKLLPADSDEFLFPSALVLEGGAKP